MYETRKKYSRVFLVKWWGFEFDPLLESLHQPVMNIGIASPEKLQSISVCRQWAGDFGGGYSIQVCRGWEGNIWQWIFRTQKVATPLINDVRPHRLKALSNASFRSLSHTSAMQPQYTRCVQTTNISGTVFGASRLQYTWYTKYMQE